MTHEITENQSFNTQPPEGGWAVCKSSLLFISRFNTQPPEGGWVGFIVRVSLMGGFNTQPPEGGWVHAGT